MTRRFSHRSLRVLVQDENGANRVGVAHGWLGQLHGWALGLELYKMYWAMGETVVWATSLFVTASPRLRHQARASCHTARVTPFVPSVKTVTCKNIPERLTIELNKTEPSRLTHYDVVYQKPNERGKQKNTSREKSGRIEKHSTGHETLCFLFLYIRGRTSVFPVIQNQNLSENPNPIFQSSLFRSLISKQTFDFDRTIGNGWCWDFRIPGWDQPAS